MFEPQTETTIDSIELNLGRRSLEENLNNKKIQFWPKWSILQINGGCLLVLGPRRAKVTSWRSRLYQLSNYAFYLHCTEIIWFARQTVKLSKKRSRHHSTKVSTHSPFWVQSNQPKAVDLDLPIP